MKRSDIHVGDELYYDRSTAWQLYAHGGQKAIVVNAEPHTITRRTWGKDTYYPDPKGKAVLVRIDDYKEPTPVLTAHLRGPYEPTAKLVAETSAAEAERRNAESKKTQDVWANAKAVEERATAAGIDTKARRIEFEDGPMMTLTPADLTKLLDAYNV
jgi:16S rRNA A1518/A1519 N6-dimethyltransferase RsmA/KsgA/DIM1 with predicted DNA glycosylase/AP lyase activity